MLRLLVRRLMVAVPTLLALTVAVFLMVRLVPGDPAQLMLGDRASPEAIAELRAQMWLDRPLYEQYGRFLYGLVMHGDLGDSIRQGQSVVSLLSEKFPATLELALCSMLLAVIGGAALGLMAAVFRGSLGDFAAMAVAVCGVSMPIFWLALLLIWIFGLELGWLPLSGRLGISYYHEPWTGLLLVDAAAAGDWGMFWSAVRHLILPSIALGTIPMAFIARMTRGTLLDVLGQDFIRTARAKGLGALPVLTKHALSNAAVPIVTITGLQFGTLLGGAIITETVFAWPGVGRWLLQSVEARDFPAVIGGVLTVAGSFVLVNTAVDLLYRWIDPRMRLS